MQYLKVNNQDDNIDPIQDLANRVKKFYYYRALFCEQWLVGDVKIQNIDEDYSNMKPIDYHPFNFTDTYVMACAAIDGLSSIWSSLSEPKTSDNNRFVNFLIQANSNPCLERISSPFLVYYLQKYPFVESNRLVIEIKNKWINNKDINECHRVYADPFFKDIENVYRSCLPESIIANNNDKHKLDKAMRKCTYASLIYKIYRCSFVHEFRSSSYACIFNTGNYISVREFESYILPDETTVELDSPKPQLDVGIGFFIETIKKGADIVYDLIIQKQCLDIPSDKNDKVMNNIL